MFFAALVCGLSFAGAAEQYGSIGNMAGSWKGYFGALKNYSNLAIPETLECKVLFISSVAQKNIHLSEKEYNTLLNFCRNGGILVIDSAANGRFSDGTRWGLRSGVLGGSLYDYNNYNSKATPLAQEIFGADAAKVLTGIKYRGAALGGASTVKALQISGKSVLFGVNRVGKGACVYISQPVYDKKSAPVYALVKTLVQKLQEPEFLDKYFPIVPELETEPAFIGNRFGAWAQVFSNAKFLSAVRVPEKLNCKFLFISSMGQNNIDFTEKEYNTLKEFCLNGGIIVLDYGSHSRFGTPKSGRNLVPGVELLGGSYYDYNDYAGKATPLAQEIFGERAAILNTKKYRGPALGALTSMKVLQLGGKSALLGVNRVGKGAVVYLSVTVNSKNPISGLLKELLMKMQESEFLDKYFPQSKPNDAAQVSGKKYHLMISGSKTPAAAKFLEGKLIAITGKGNFNRGNFRDTIKIHIGITPEVEKLKLDFKTLHHYGYYMIKKDNMIILAGKNSQANMYAVNDFLKRFAGYRKFGDHPITEVIPRKEFISLPQSFSLREEPDILSYYTPWTGNSDFGRNSRTIAMSTHSMNKFIPPAMYADKHPEWYSFINGKRVSFKGKKKPHWQPCLNNPELGRLALAYADRHFKKSPHSLTLPFGVNDGAGDCRCDYCMELDKKYGNRYAVLYNIAARAIKKKYPNKLIGFIAYGQAYQVPRNIKMEDNILVEVCNIGMVNSYVDYAKWQAIGIKHFALYDYFYTFGGRHVVPRHFPHYMIDVWNKEFKKFPVKAIWLEYYPKTRIFELARQYVFDEYVWNTKVDVESLLNDYFSSMYGYGAKEVRAYFDYLEKVFVRRKYYTIWPDESNVEQMRVYQMEDLIALDKLLAAAAKKFSGGKDIYARRFDLLVKAWKLARLYIEADICVRNLQQGKDIIANARRGYELGDLISSFKYSPEDEKLIFTRKSTVASMRHRLSRLHPLAHLDKVFDRLLDELTAAKLKKESKKSVAAYYRNIAKSSSSEQFRRAVLSQVWQLENKSENIVRNGGFEQGKNVPASATDNEKVSDWIGFKGLPGWFTWQFPDSEMQAIRTTKYARSGKYSAGIAGNQVSGGMCTTVPLKAGCRYRYTVYVYRNDDNNGKGLGGIGLRMKRKGQWLDYGTAIGARATKACVGKWEKLEVTFSAPNQDAAGLLVLSPPRQGTKSLFLVDDVSVVKIFDPDSFK